MVFFFFLNLWFLFIFWYIYWNLICCCWYLVYVNYILFVVNVVFGVIGGSDVGGDDVVIGIL